jgi:diadenosine tetraphosphatase ApaH/serine/threonine PP2A family protein phosphatase
MKPVFAGGRELESPHMKIAIFSDLHSNLEAFRACRDHALARGAERFVCLGDCVGYGADPVATLDMLRELPGLIAVLGNNDEYVVAPALMEFPSRAVRESVEWTRRHLSSEQIEFLDSLKYIRVEDGVTYVHASAHNPNEWPYILKPSQARACLASAVTDLVFVGHVHIPFLFEKTADDDGAMNRDPLPGQPYTLRRDASYVCCVGSVGQPRDGDSRACYVAFDNSTRTLTFERVSYDHERAAEKIRAAGLPELFAARLESGH